jgi:hypothetical protein
LDGGSSQSMKEMLRTEAATIATQPLSEVPGLCSSLRRKRRIDRVLHFKFPLAMYYIEK